jgi:hypothetical protein
MLYTPRIFTRTTSRRHNEQRPGGATGDTRTPCVCCRRRIREIPGFPCDCRTQDPNVFRYKGQFFRSFLYDVRSQYGGRIPDPALRSFSSSSSLGARDRSARAAVGEIQTRVSNLARVLKKASCRLLKKIHRRDARKIDDRRRIYSTSERGD